MPFTGFALTGFQRGLSLVIPIFLYYIPILDLIAVILYVIVFTVVYVYTALFVLWISFLLGEINVTVI